MASKGLSASEAQQRLQQYGRNALAAKKKEAGRQSFLREYRDFLQILLKIDIQHKRAIDM
ncbi:MAG: hypothetical protein KDE48_12960 [Anaerolineales bacterium]|nr:hypothetical protein [Anaerolineales bacterium]